LDLVRPFLFLPSTWDTHFIQFEASAMELKSTQN
jgi:hypothetical protein